MTDSRLRELERAFIESNAPEDHLAWLRERVRQGESLDWESYSRLAELNVEAASEYLLARVERGDLEREKLELAAYCSHEPARVALGHMGLMLEDRNVDRPYRLADSLVHVPQIGDWAAKLTAWHHEAAVLAALVAGRLALQRWEHMHPDDPRPRLALASAEAYAACPCDDHASKAEESEAQAWSIANEYTSPRNSPEQDEAAAYSTVEAANAVFLATWHKSNVDDSEDWDHLASYTYSAVEHARLAGLEPSDLKTRIEWVVTTWALVDRRNAAPGRPQG